MQFHIVMHKLVMSAALLPSLNAEYSMENLTSKGMTGSKAKFVVDLPKHTLSFNTKLQAELDGSAEANLPSEASIDLPKVRTRWLKIVHQFAQIAFYMVYSFMVFFA